MVNYLLFVTHARTSSSPHPFSLSQIPRGQRALTSLLTVLEFFDLARGPRPVEEDALLKLIAHEVTHEWLPAVEHLGVVLCSCQARG